jgi:radical SAM-linked protein
LKAQRLRFRYRLTPQAAAIGQRDLVQAWAQALKDGGVPVAYSEGKRAFPQISPAAPLPMGVTSDGELLDVYLSEPISPAGALQAVAGRLPPGIEPLEATEIGVAAPSLQSQVRWAEYEVDVPAAGLDPSGVCRRIDAMLGAETLPSEYKREAKTRRYDLRPLVLAVWLEATAGDTLRLRMRLRAEPEMTARADQVVLALGLPEATRIHRSRLYVEESQPVILAYRRLGEPGDG